MATDKVHMTDAGMQSVAEVHKRAQHGDVPSDVTEAIERALLLLEAKVKYCQKHTFSDTPGARMIAEKTCAMPWKELYDQKKVKTLYANFWMSESGQGQLLQFLARMQKAKRFLEIGMFTGYAAMSVAEVLPDDGKVVTCEYEPYLVEITRNNFATTPHSKKIDIREGQAMDTLHALASEGQEFDLVYLDANKDGYLAYFKTLLDKHLLAEGGTVVVDNTFYFGNAYKVPGSLMDVFNDAVFADPRVEQIMLSISDGVTLIRRKGE